METTNVEKIETKEVSIDTFIGSELKKFEVDEAGLIATAAKYRGLKVESVEDKQGIKAVRAARLELKEIRVGITKKAKALREGAVKFQKAVIAREEELIDLIKPTEVYLEAEEDRIAEEIQFLKEEEERRESQRIQNMIEQLAAYNYGVDFHQLKGLTDDQFATLLQEAREKFEEAERERLRLAEIEAERLRLEAEARLAEEERLKQIAAEQAEKERVLREREEEVRKAQEEIRKAKEEMQKAIDDENRKREAEAMEKERQLELERLKKQAEEKAVQEERERVRKEAEAKAEAERLEKEAAEREEAERPDKEKIILFADKLEVWITTELPVCSTEKGTALVSTIRDKVLEVTLSMRTMAKRKRW